MFETKVIMLRGPQAFRVPNGPQGYLRLIGDSIEFKDNKTKENIRFPINSIKKVTSQTGILFIITESDTTSFYFGEHKRSPLQAILTPAIQTSEITEWITLLQSKNPSIVVESGTFRIVKVIAITLGIGFLVMILLLAAFVLLVAS